MSYDLEIDRITGDLADWTTDLTRIGSESEDVAQRVWVALRTQRGTYAFDTDFGVDWTGLVLTKYDEGVATAEIRRAILAADDRITGIPSLELVYDAAARSLAVTADIRVGEEIQTVSLEV